MVQKKTGAGRPGGKPRKAGLLRDVLVNWLRHDTSIFHDSFPATEENVRRVIRELEHFPGCHIKGTDTFNVDKVAEWVRVNAAPFAERMEPPAFLEGPAPDDGEVDEGKQKVAPPGAPPSEQELKEIHLESAVWDKVDLAAASEILDREIGRADPDEKPSGDWKPGDEVVTQILPGGFLQDDDDRVTQILDPSQVPGRGEGEPAPAPGKQPDREQRPPRAGSPDALAARVLEEVNATLDGSFERPAEAVEALASAYRGLREGLHQLVTEVRALTGREMGKVRDPGLLMEAVRGSVRETIEGLRKQLRSRPAQDSDRSREGLGAGKVQEMLAVVPEEIKEAVKNAGVDMDAPEAYLRAVVERLGATASENRRLQQEMTKMKTALERQFQVTQQIKAAWTRIAEELEEYKRHKTMSREKSHKA